MLIGPPFSLYTFPSIPNFFFIFYFCLSCHILVLMWLIVLKEETCFATRLGTSIPPLLETLSPPTVRLGLQHPCYPFFIPLHSHHPPSAPTWLAASNPLILPSITFSTKTINYCLLVQSCRTLPPCFHQLLATTI